MEDGLFKTPMLNSKIPRYKTKLLSNIGIKMPLYCYQGIIAIQQTNTHVASQTPNPTLQELPLIVEGHLSYYLCSYKVMNKVKL